mmetsp:Transcript_9079/g.11815  ORF Transcript_9079/g.11815 Transcript_9079/m.11815 type:complete len:302 (-) Transcript_9079:462-1367(-)
MNCLSSKILRIYYCFYLLSFLDYIFAFKGINGIQNQDPQKIDLISPVTLITFDVGSTLLKSTGSNPNGIHKEALSHACHKVFGINGHIDEIDRRGNTDSLAMLSLLDLYGFPIDVTYPAREELYAAAVEYALDHEKELGLGLTPLPGVHALLEALSAKDNVLISLATGNLEGIAWAKLRSTDLIQYFSEPRFGGFSTDFCSGGLHDKSKGNDRAKLVSIAKQKAELAYPTRSIQTQLHIGDSLSDLMAGEIAGVTKCFGVATGKYSVEQLEKAKKLPTTTILANLEEGMPSILEALQVPTV